MFITVNLSIGKERYGRNAMQEQIQIEVPDSLLKLIKPQLSTMISETTNKILEMGIAELEKPTDIPEEVEA